MNNDLYRPLTHMEKIEVGDEFYRSGDNTWIKMDEPNVSRAKSCGLSYWKEGDLPMRRIK